MGMLGFKHSRLHPGVFHRPNRNVYMIAHVDDLLMVGTVFHLKWAKSEIEKSFDIKGDLLSEGQPVRFLGRKLSATPGGFVWEADPNTLR